MDLKFYEQLGVIWKEFLEDVNQRMSARTFFMVSTVVVHQAVFVGFNLALYLCHRFRWFEKYKIPSKQLPSRELVWECLKHLFINQFVIQWPMAWLLFGLLSRFELHVTPELPSFLEVCRDLLVFVLCEDFFFYWSHRALHHPLIYKHIHKQHHRFKATIGIASEYAHPVEVLVSNSLPFLSGPLLMGPHIVTWWCWIVLRITETIDAHSGYSFPLSPFSLLPFQGGSERHFFHHSHNLGSYGSFFNFWDRICGTDRPFVEFQKSQQQQHGHGDSTPQKKSKSS